MHSQKLTRSGTGIAVNIEHNFLREHVTRLCTHTDKYMICVTVALQRSVRWDAHVLCSGPVSCSSIET